MEGKWEREIEVQTVKVTRWRTERWGESGTAQQEHVKYEENGRR